MMAALGAEPQQVQVPLAVLIAGTKNDHPGRGEADPVCLSGVRRLWPERGIEPGKGHPAAVV
jgi:hypothetical protein